MKLRKLRVTLAAGLAVALSLIGGPIAQAAGRITIGSNPQGSLYYVIGGGLAKLLTEKIGREAIVQPYAGSSVYLPLINGGEVTVGLSSSLDSGRVYAAGGDSLRALARLWPLAYGYMVRANSGIKTIADLKGKRVVVEIKPNASLAAANRAILASAGLSEADVEAVAIGGLPQGSKGVVEGTIDATSIAVGIPLTRTAHAAVSGGISYPALTGPNATSEFLNSQVPGLYTVTVAPSKGRPGVSEPTLVAGFDIFLVGSSKLSDAEVSDILATVHAHFGDLQKDYPPLRGGKAELFASPTNTVPYHPAAIRYFRDKGLWTEANDRHEKTLSR